MNEINNTISRYSISLDKLKELLRLCPLDDHKYDQLIEIYFTKTKIISDILKTCLSIIKRRENSFKIIVNLKKHIRGNETIPIDKFLIDYQGIRISMFEASLLSTALYLSCTWSLYDSIQKILLTILKIKSPDITTSFSAEKSPFSNFSCFNFYDLIYSNHYLLSYKFRNLFIHESGYINGKSILVNKEVHDLFIIDDSLLKKINEIIGKELVIEGDLIKQLKNANDNIDLFFNSLLNYSIDSYITEIQCLIDDDKFKRHLIEIL